MYRQAPLMRAGTINTKPLYVVYYLPKELNSLDTTPKLREWKCLGHSGSSVGGTRIARIDTVYLDRESYISSIGIRRKEGSVSHWVAPPVRDGEYPGFR